MTWAVALSACLATLATGCVGLPRGAPLHPHNPPGTWYVVQPGETLEQLATRAGVPLEDLRELNGLRAGELLEPGRLVFVLFPDEEAGPPSVASAPARGEAQLRWPLAAPRLTSPFGLRQGRVHEGIDMGAPTGTPILAAQDGRVLYAGDAVRGYGNMVVVEHRDELLTVYAHGSVLLVRTGDRVSAGQEIARVGASGRATAPHLHFEVRRGQVPQDPLRFLPAPEPGR